MDMSCRHSRVNRMCPDNSLLQIRTAPLRLCRLRCLESNRTAASVMAWVQALGKGLELGLEPGSELGHMCRMFQDMSYL